MLVCAISWEQRRLGEVCEITMGQSPDGTTYSDTPSDYILVQGNADLKDGWVCPRIWTTQKTKTANAGDLIMSVRAPAGAMGKTAYDVVLGRGVAGIKGNELIYQLLVKMDSDGYWKKLAAGSTFESINSDTVINAEIVIPQDVEEQQKIGSYFRTLDHLITLHQREPPKEDKILNDIKTDTLFHEYYCQWLVIYKEGSVRGVTMQKYHLTAEWVKKLIPDVKLCDFDRITYQQLINDYAETHERQTTMDFHHQLKGAILDAVDDGLIARDPTRKVIIKGKSPNDKKKKYLSRYELQKLLTSLDLNSGLNMDWLILLIAKTGMRFSEAIAVTPMDFDFTHQTLSVNKTWDYKGEGGFQPTKNKSSVRKIRLDWQTVGQFYAIVRELNDTAPIFVSKEKKIYNSTLNDVLERHCKAVGIPTISVHGLRHTHASLLLFDGVSIASVAQRLGHSSINTTQKTYLHIIRELENKDIDLIMKSISSLLD